MGVVEHAVAPAPEFWPAGQVRQKVAPVEGTYLPAPQSTQSARNAEPVKEL
jgi:hypothetical protein